MTTKLKTLITQVQELSPPEQWELIHVISFSLSRKHGKILVQEDFWNPMTLEQIVQAQHTPIIENIDELAVDFWPENESVDEFIEYIYQQRQEDQCK
jgi:hypothetical protein